MTREAWEKWLAALGADVANTVSKRVDAVLVGVDPGSNKLNRAMQLGTPIISIQFAEYLGLLDKRVGAEQTPVTQYVPTIVLNMAILAEELYAAARAGDESAFRAFGHARDAIGKLLQATWGDVTDRPD